jgi:D-alanyl-D-alanine carboxypeptidase/D-alanyl-D-alanine-endopeptidase (penicillin-binding protein 4)
MTWRSVAVVMVGLAAGERIRAPPTRRCRRWHCSSSVPVRACSSTRTTARCSSPRRPTSPSIPRPSRRSRRRLALLEKLGPTHRFETRVTGTGTLRERRLAGDLVFHGGNDPFFVFESAFLVLQRLRALGCARSAARSRRGPVHLQLAARPDRRAARARAPRQGRRRRLARRSPGAERFDHGALRLDDGHVTADGDALVVSHQSPDLVACSSPATATRTTSCTTRRDTIGGPHASRRSRGRRAAALPRRDRHRQRAGGGTTNACRRARRSRILRKLETHSREIGHQITDILPVSGVDPGTLKERLLDHRRYVVGKTGTFGSVGPSALVGLLRSPRYGTVAFGVLNTASPVPQARAKQDAFVAR